MRRYSSLVYSIALRAGLSKEDVNDVYQSTWAVAFSKGLPPPEGIVRFLASTVTWILRDRRKLEARRGPIPADSRPPPGGEPLPEAVVADLERRQLIYEALASLRPRDRKLLEDIFLSAEPLSYRDLADKLSVSIGSIGPLRARALERLRASLAKRGVDRV